MKHAKAGVFGDLTFAPAVSSPSTLTIYARTNKQRLHRSFDDNSQCWYDTNSDQHSLRHSQIGILTGTITFQQGSTTLGTATLDQTGIASITFTAPGRGQVTYTAS